MEGFICGIYINQKTKPSRKLWWYVFITLVENLKTFNIIDHNVLFNIAIFSDACLTGSDATFDGHSYHIWWPCNWWSLECWRIKESHTLLKKSPYSGLFWSAFSRIRTEYGEILRISPYSVRMRENVDQNNSEYGHFLRSVNLGWHRKKRLNSWMFPVSITCSYRNRNLIIHFLFFIKTSHKATKNFSQRYWPDLQCY